MRFRIPFTNPPRHLVVGTSAQARARPKEVASPNATSEPRPRRALLGELLVHGSAARAPRQTQAPWEGAMLRLGNADASEVRVGYYANAGCRAPGWNSQLSLSV